MADYLITRLPLGTTRANIVQFFNRIKQPFFVSSKDDEITGFMHEFEESAAVRSNQSFPLETKGSKAEPGIIRGPQRLVSGKGVGVPLEYSGANPLSIQRAASVFRPVGGFAVISNSSRFHREPRAINAVDILTEAASGAPQSVTFSSGNPNLLDSIVKKEEEPEDTNPLFSQDLPPRPQPTYSLFPLGTHAEALMEEDVDEDATVATESFVKEELDNDEFDDFEDLDEKDGGKSLKEAHQGAPSVFRPAGGSSVMYNSSFHREPLAINAVDVLTEAASGVPPSVIFSSGNPNVLDSIVKEEPEDTNPLFSQDLPPRPQPTYSLFPLGTHAEALMEEDVDEDATVATESFVKEEPDDDEFDDSEDLDEEDGGKYLKEAHQAVSTADLSPNEGLHDGVLFKCIVCNDVFSDPLLHTECKEVHKRAPVHSDAPKCDICGKCFITKKGLSNHLRIHSEEKSFGCEVCRKRFAQRDYLYRHMRIHTGEKPYECIFCHKSFTQNSSLRRHIRTHTGEKPYECTVCQMKFSDLSNLKNHRIRCHGCI